MTLKIENSSSTSWHMESRSLNFLAFRSWRRRVLKCMSPHLDLAVLKWLKTHPPRHFVDDNLAWMESAVLTVKGHEPDLRECLTELLPGQFDFIRGFHGCRPVSLESYQKRGIVPATADWFEKETLECFGDTPRVREVLAELNKEERGGSYLSANAGKIYFCLHMEELIDRCGHYLLYGSEYLLCVAKTIGRPEVLRKRGKATIIECDVPIGEIPRDYLLELSGQLLCEIAERYCTGESGFDGGGFLITNRLAPRHIVAFHHPKGIPNPHNMRMLED